jgi:hypothetical protein
MSNSVAIIDYGMGNLRSVAKAIEHMRPADTVVVTSRPGRSAVADRVVFPGQGAMPDCMRELDARGLRPAVLEAARNKPFPGDLHRPADALRAQRRRQRAWPRHTSGVKSAAFPPSAWWPPTARA